MPTSVFNARGWGFVDLEEESVKMGETLKNFTTHVLVGAMCALIGITVFQFFQQPEKIYPSGFVCMENDETEQLEVYHWIIRHGGRFAVEYRPFQRYGTVPEGWLIYCNGDGEPELFFYAEGFTSGAFNSKMHEVQMNNPPFQATVDAGVAATIDASQRFQATVDAAITATLEASQP